MPRSTYEEYQDVLKDLRRRADSGNFLRDDDDDYLERLISQLKREGYRKCEECGELRLMEGDSCEECQHDRDTAQYSPECSICRRRHGLEVIHACE